ncbi:MAG: T9SS type A sorting domain-containing protein, partial [Crocinitomicaceae bacterium]
DVVQKFDLTHGVDHGSGTIDAIRVMFAAKNDAGNGTSVALTVWDDNAGKPGTVLGTGSVAISAIDTTQGGIQLLTDGTSLFGVYNTEVTLTGVNIPSNGTFWVGVEVDGTGNGDTVIVLTTRPAAAPYNGTTDFADASTHAGLNNTSIGFVGYPSLQASLLMANFIYPVVTYPANASVNENDEYVVRAYPNPASDNFRIELPDMTARTISVISMTGQVLKTINVNNLNVTVNVSDLESGVYFYQLKGDNGMTLATKKIIVKR